MNAEHRAKISAALKGKPKSAEHRAHMAEVKRTPEWRAKLSAATKGKPLSPEHLASLRRRPSYGRSNHESMLLKLYGMTEAEFTQRMEYQGNGCAICGRPRKTRPLAVDHDHNDGRIRGLLCHACNKALGVFGDNVVGLQRAVAYLCPSFQDMVREFAFKFGLPTPRSPQLENYRFVLRSDLIEEEWKEFRVAAEGKDMVGMVDALCDLLYVIYGAAVELGINLTPFFKEVHDSNMRKEGGGTRPDGKIMKPEGWKRPRIELLLRKIHGYG